MTEQPQTPENEEQATESVARQDERAPVEPVTEVSPAPSPAAAASPSPPPPPAPAAPPAPEPFAGSGASAGAAERPELAVGGAFAGGFLLALILKRLAR